MAEIDKSIKLVFNEFQRSIAEVPLEVYYQVLNSDFYNASGFQFNIKLPGSHALLDTDVWVEYNLRVRETADNAIKNMFENNATAAAAVSTAGWAASENKFALRSGWALNRTIQNFSIQINNQTLNIRPGYIMDVLNRLYISNDQAEHEFSTSGGRFEEGNHGHRLGNPRIGNPKFGQAPTALAGTTQAASFSTQLINGALQLGNAADAAGDNAAFLLYAMARDPYHVPPALPGAGNHFIYGWPEYPNTYEFTNPGFDKRWSQMALRLRQNLTSAGDGGTASNATVGNMIVGTLTPTANQFYYNIKIYERLPIPIFKMYSNDEQYGVIPNLTQMQIQGNFVNNMARMLFRGNTDALNIDLWWDGVTTSMCRIFLRWYTPPTSMQIPREIHIPYKKIVTWSKTAALQSSAAANPGVNYKDYSEVNEYNITLEAIPDLLLIYMRLQAGDYTFDTPDDFNMEITSLSLNIDNASGKVNQITSLDLYHKWKRLLKHSDNKIIGYEEWRRYCCVACLQPEDYGVRYGPGYSNPCVLGFKFIPRNWHFTPSIHAGPPNYAIGAPIVPVANTEYIGGAAGAGVNTELVVTQIYYKNKLIIRADGTAKQEMVKISADFEMNKPVVSEMGLPYGTMNA